MGTASNREVIRFLFDHSALLELDGANDFKVRAFANAARMIEELEVDVAEMAAEGTLTSIEGVGKGVAELITEFLGTGKAAAHEELTGKVPTGLLDVLRIPGLGTKKVKAIYDALRVESVSQLEAACRAGKLAGLAGFGPKTEKNILKAVAGSRKFRGRFRLHDALAAAEPVLEALRAHPNSIRVSIAGSLRRRKETVKDIDIVLSSEAQAAVSDSFVQHPSVIEVLAQGDTKTSVRLDRGIQADLRIVDDDHFSSILHHFTGSADHNVQMRSRALSRGMHLNEYGLFQGENPVPCANESELFAAVGLDYIPPELREGLGEVVAAESGELPDLISSDDIRGMLHIHSDYSDGSHTLGEMAEAVRLRGYEYAGICDHSKSAGYVFGLKDEDVRQQWAEIDALNDEYDDFHIFKGIESDILKDGTLDYDDDLLAGFDFVVIAVHAPLNMDEDEMTRRVIKAIEHPSTTVLAHPTGRIILERDGFPINVEAILAAAAANNVAVELNAHPYRLDLDWRHLRKARELGVKIAINTDAHSVGDLDYVEFGIGTARKGWLQADDVINTLACEDLAAYFDSTNGRQGAR